MEYPTDAYLVQLVRIQQLAQSISLMFAFRGAGVQAGLSVNIMAESFQQQIDSYRSMLPEHLKENGELDPAGGLVSDTDTKNSRHHWPYPRCRDKPVRGQPARRPFRDPCAGRPVGDALAMFQRNQVLPAMALYRDESQEPTIIALHTSIRLHVRLLDVTQAHDAAAAGLGPAPRPERPQL